MKEAFHSRGFIRALGILNRTHMVSSTAEWESPGTLSLCLALYNGDYRQIRWAVASLSLSLLV